MPGLKDLLKNGNGAYDLSAVNTDWMHKYRGSSKLLLLPRTTQEVHFFLILDLLISISFSLLFYWINCSIALV